MGTLTAFRNVITRLNIDKMDRNDTIIFPGATSEPDSQHTIALPESSSPFVHQYAILPEGKHITIES